MVNWNTLISTPQTRSLISGFSTGSVSGRQLTTAATNTPAAGEVRKLLRSGGVTRARSIARKALKRRG